MSDLIIISRKKSNDCPIRTQKRLTELKKLNFKELEKIIDGYGIITHRLVRGIITKEILIKGIISHEILLENKLTEIIINIDNQNKSYFIKTIRNFVSVTKRYLDDNEIYIINFNLCSAHSSMEILYNKGRFSYDNHILNKHANLYNDMELCRKATLFIESLNFYLKVKYLLYAFDGINDIIINICFVYFERTLSNISNIKYILQ